MKPRGHTYRADVDVLVVTKGPAGPWTVAVPLKSDLAKWVLPEELPHAWIEPACRCYRCGHLLTEGEVTADRIVPGCQGGTYRRDNIRPACARCNSATGATTRSKARAAA